MSVPAIILGLTALMVDEVSRQLAGLYISLMVVSWKHMNGGHEDPHEMMDTSHHLSRLVLNSHVPQAERNFF